MLALQGCNLFLAQPRPFVKDETYYGTGTTLLPGDHPRKILLAFSVKDGKPVWRYPQIGDAESWGGTLTTAGVLVFFGDDAGSLEAVEATIGRALWHSYTGQRMHAWPMTYSADDTQYVFIAAGSDGFTFALP